MWKQLSTRGKSLIIEGVVLWLALSPVGVIAQDGQIEIIPSYWNSDPCNIENGMMKAACIPEFIGNIISVIFSLISAFFLLNVIYAGYQIAMGSWTGEKSEGKDRLQWSMIGLVICVCSFLILDLVVSVILPL